MPSEIVSRPHTAFFAPGTTFETIGADVADVAFTHPGWQRWWIAFLAALALVGVLVVLVGILLFQGVGMWGNNIPVTWALDIVSYDWWMSVACGGLMTSAVLLLIDARWRSSVSRVVETMALLSACAAAIYPIIHLGRPWFFYWNLPYPNSMLLWPQFRSPLYWDAADIISFLGVSLSFWYIGMLPDFATLRDRATEQARADDGRGLLRAQIYGIAALGWRGSAIHWQRWTRAYRTIALFGVLVAVALQAGASVMFAGTVEPGWHSTIMPFEFIAVALWTGVAVATALLVVVRWTFALDALITPRHLDILGRLLLGLGLLNLYCYLTDAFVTALTGNAYERAQLARRAFGEHAWAIWLVLGCALLPVHLFWVPRLRRAPLLLFAVGGLVAIGMYADHFMVIVDTLQHDFLPSSAQPYRIVAWGAGTFFGDVGLFAVLMLLALRYLPVVSILEARRLAPIAQVPHRGPEAIDDVDAPLWAVSAEFEAAEAMVAAVAFLRARSLGRIEAYSPIPVPAVDTALRLTRPAIGSAALVGALLGGTFMFLLCTYATVWDYVFDIGGRPRFSWPYFVIPSFAFATLCGTLGVLAVLLVLNRLPRLNHPAFNIPGFGSSTQDRFFAVVEARDDDFDVAAVERALLQLEKPPLRIARVPR
jgi:Ni/Fe-hydrogenase subunit HybB-like protein